MSETNHITIAAPAEDPNSAAYEDAYNYARSSEHRARVGRRTTVAVGSLAFAAGVAGLLGANHAHGETRAADTVGAGVAIGAAGILRKKGNQLGERAQRHGSNAEAIGAAQIRYAARTDGEAPAWATEAVRGASGLEARHLVGVTPTGAEAQTHPDSIHDVYRAGEQSVHIVRPSGAEPLVFDVQIPQQPQPNAVPHRNPGA